MYELLPLVLAIAALVMLRRAETRISKLEDQVKALQQRPAAPMAAAALAREDYAPAIAEVEPGPVAAAEVVSEPAEDEIVEPVAARVEPTPAPVAETVAAPEKTARPARSLESTIGARWPVWVGGLALALGGIFMVKYSIENGLISPGVRLLMAAAFGMILAAAGEWIRRRGQAFDLPALRHALVPGVLTAAGSVTLFGAIYAAYGFYGYLGPVTAFAALAIVAIGTVALSLLHGQALAGLGLLAAMITPFLIETEAPSAWGLFIYLTIAWLATMAAARIRGWNIVPAFANLFILVWYVAFMANAPGHSVWAMVTSVLVVVATLAVLWPAGDGEGTDDQPDAATFADWRRSILKPSRHATIRVTGALAVLGAAAAHLLFGDYDGISQLELGQFVIMIGALALAGAWRRSGMLYAIGSLVAMGLGVLDAVSGNIFNALDQLDGSGAATVIADASSLIPVVLVSSFVFAVIGNFAIRRHAARSPAYAVLWSALAWMTPLSILLSSFLFLGNYNGDMVHGIVALAFAAAFLAEANWHGRRVEASGYTDVIVGGLVFGSYFAVVLALHALTQSVVTTILVSVAGFAYLMGTRLRPWPSLIWVLGLSGVVVLARIAWQPTLVSDLALSRTPFFNQLLPGYGIPAILTGLGAYMVRNGPSPRARNFLQALASLLGLMTVAVLVRHAMNGGVLSGNAPSLGEQSIYTLISVGGSAVLMTLDMKSPSPVLRWGSMIVGTISLLSALSAHVFALNPYFSGELTGNIPIFNLLLLGYLLPALGFFGLAWYARGKRPVPYVIGLAVAGALMTFLWVTLSVRWFWQGQGIAMWKGFQQGEMYTYSVVWLILGVVLLAVGSRFNARSLRLSSAVMVFASVIKVFLIDMSNLEGILRAASFIGLGAVLIGIGLFYQRVLRRAAGVEPAENETPA